MKNIIIILCMCNVMNAMESQKWLLFLVFFIISTYYMKITGQKLYSFIETWEQLCGVVGWVYRKPIIDETRRKKYCLLCINNRKNVILIHFVDFFWVCDYVYICVFERMNLIKQILNVMWVERWGKFGMVCFSMSEEWIFIDIHLLSWKVLNRWE